MLRILSLTLIASILLTSCGIQRSTYYHEGFEPVISPKEFTVQGAVSISPLLFRKASASVSITDHFVLRGGYTGKSNIDNFDGAALYYQDISSIFGVFAGGTFNYQHNVRQGKVTDNFFSQTIRQYKYNCEFYSPGLVLGFSLKAKKTSWQFIFKASQNTVTNYNVFYRVDGEDNLGDPIVKDNENINQIIPAFYSGEIGFNLMVPLDQHLFLKIGNSILFTQNSFEHNYSFESKSTSKGPTIVETTKMHPIANVVHFSFGFIFLIGKKNPDSNEPGSFQKN